MNLIDYFVAPSGLTNRKEEVNTDIYQNVRLQEKQIRKAGNYAEDMAAEMLTTTMGLPRSSLKSDHKQKNGTSGKTYKSQKLYLTCRRYYGWNVVHRSKCSSFHHLMSK